VPERVSAEGEILSAPTEEDLATLVERVRASGAEAVAISLLFSFANPETERRVEAALNVLGLPVSVSHRILPEFREFERASTTVVNAYLAPRIERYLTHLAERVSAEHSGGRVHVMQSSGGIIRARVAAREPVRTVLSGPAGGVVGASRLARWAGFERIIGFDMGGTSTDVFLSDEATGGARLTRESVVAGVPSASPCSTFIPQGPRRIHCPLRRWRNAARRAQSAGAEPGRSASAAETGHRHRCQLVLGRLDPGSFLAVECSLTRAD